MHAEPLPAPWQGKPHTVLAMHLDVEPQRPRPVILVSLYQAGLGVLGSAFLARVTVCMCMGSTNTVGMIHATHI